MILLIFCFYRVIPELGEASENPSGVKKIVFCTGKVFYDIRKARKEKGLDKDIAIARVEQVTFCIPLFIYYYYYLSHNGIAEVSYV